MITTTSCPSALWAVYTKIERKLPSTNQKCLNFIGNSQAMWEMWGEIFPFPDAPFLFDHTKDSIEEDQREKDRKKCEDFDRLPVKEKNSKDNWKWNHYYWTKLNKRRRSCKKELTTKRNS